MTVPSVETARNWSGLTAVDSDDQLLGRITDIYLDHDTGQPEWALVATPQRGRRTFVPLAGAARTGDRVTVAVPKAAVGEAPAVRPPGCRRPIHLPDRNSVCSRRGRALVPSGPLGVRVDLRRRAAGPDREAG